MRGPLSLLRDLWESEEKAFGDETRTMHEYVINPREKLQESCKPAQEELEKARVCHQHYYDKHTSDREVESGKVLCCFLTINSSCNGRVHLPWQGKLKLTGITTCWTCRLSVIIKLTLSAIMSNRA